MIVVVVGIEDKYMDILFMFLIKKYNLNEKNIQFDFGYAQEDADQIGYTNFMMDMLNEGTKKYSSLEFDEVLDSLGANMGFGSDLDTSYVSISSLKLNLDLI